MNKRVVLDVGNCGPDHLGIKRLLATHFQVEVLQTHSHHDTLELLRKRPVDLVLINRKLDCDYSDGSQILVKIKADASLSSTPVMVITNYSEHQEAAIALGAERGFGKLEFQDPATIESLSRFLA